MSRIGKRPVAIPDKVKVDIAPGLMTVTGPNGTLNRTIPQEMVVKLKDGEAIVERPEANRKNQGYQGLVRALLANMVEGVTKGFERSLVINGVGYKCEQRGTKLVFSLGYTHQIELDLPDGIKAELDKSQTNVTIKGADKQLVGQIAAKIRSFKIPEPYKAKGVRYSDETIRRKVGKAGAK